MQELHYVLWLMRGLKMYRNFECFSIPAVADRKNKRGRPKQNQYLDKLDCFNKHKMIVYIDILDGSGEPLLIAPH